MNSPVGTKVNFFTLLKAARFFGLILVTVK